VRIVWFTSAGRRTLLLVLWCGHGVRRRTCDHGVRGLEAQGVCEGVFRSSEGFEFFRRFRVGFVTLGVGIFTTELLANVPLTLDFSAWYLSSVWLPLLAIGALAVWGFYCALAGQKLWKTELFS